MLRLIGWDFLDGDIKVLLVACAGFPVLTSVRRWSAQPLWLKLAQSSQILTHHHDQPKRCAHIGKIRAMQKPSTTKEGH